MRTQLWIALRCFLKNLKISHSRVQLANYFSTNLKNNKSFTSKTCFMLKNNWKKYRTKTLSLGVIYLMK